MSTDYRTFYEAGMLTDILDYVADKPGKDNLIGNTWSGIQDVLGGKGFKSKDEERVIRNNIAKSAHGLTAIFPVIVSKAVDVEKAVMVSKAIERKAVTMLQMLFSAHQITSVSNARDYLGKFHHNLDKDIDFSDMSVDDVINYTAMEETVDPGPIANKAMRQINEHVQRNIHYTLNTELDNPSISSYRVKAELLHETRFSRDPVTTSSVTTRYVRSSPNDPWEPDTLSRDQRSDEVFNSMRSQGLLRDVTRTDASDLGAQDFRSIANWYGGQVLQSDIKKANEAQPTMMIINFVHNKDVADHINNSCVIGVKAYIHYVDPEDIVNRVILKQSDNRGLFNLIRATTGEIAFFKDFLFAVDRAKVDAVAKQGKGSTNKIWKLLELRADRLKGAKVTRQDQASSAAISTLVISKAEVDFIKQHHRIDLSRPGTCKGILRGYNMMAIAIVDDVLERVDFLYDDGSIEFESLSFASLEREEASSMYKKVINLATRGR